MEKYELTMEQLQSAKEAKSPEELVVKAKEQGFDITLERAAEFLGIPPKDGDVSDDELDNVAGGHGGMCHNSGREVVTTMTTCVHNLKSEPNKSRIRTCGNATDGHRGQSQSITTGGDAVKHMVDVTGIGKTDCEWLLYEKGLWLCNYPEHLKK